MDKLIHSFNQLFFLLNPYSKLVCAQCRGYNKHEREKYESWPLWITQPSSDLQFTKYYNPRPSPHASVQYEMCPREFIHSFILLFNIQFLSNYYDPSTLLALWTLQIKKFPLLLHDSQSNAK